MDLNLWKNKKKELKLTNQDIANNAQLPLRTVEQIMCGKVKNPRIDTVEAIEKVLGLNQFRGWTPEEKAAGVGRRAIYLSDEEYDWLEIRSEILRVKGEDYLSTLTNMLEAITKDENNQVKK